jgi:nucleoid-associated protein YgaU
MCPHCQSDLEIYQLIIQSNQQRQTGRKIISALGIFAAVTAIGWASSGIFSGTNTTPQTTEVVELCPEQEIKGEIRNPSDAELIAMLQNENEMLKLENVSLTDKLTAAKKVKDLKKEAIQIKAAIDRPANVEKSTAQDEAGTIIHTVRNGDTFWIISKKYFGTGAKYKQIAKDNGLSVKTKLQKGMKIKIVKS